MLGKKNKKKEEIEQPDFDQADIQRHLDLLKDVLENTQNNIKKALNLLSEKNFDNTDLLDSLLETKEASEGFVASNGQERIVEGVFTGEKMIAGDGIEYNIPANYASKSKLVEGDILKLTISRDGSFIYKQIGPVERKQLVANLAHNAATGEWIASLDNQRWKLLPASVTYFHGLPGDEVVIIISKEGKSKWAAVENIIKHNNH
ncbi:MAG: hypothetical protein WCW26_01515 [Candidatus Buchananbacteria bacterium]